MGFSASAKSIVTEQAWYEDKTASLSFSAAKEQRFTPFTGLLSRGYTTSAYWIRLRLDPSLSPDPTGRYVVRLQPSYVDSITLFDPLANADQPRPITGDLTPWSNDSYRSLNFNFVIEAPGPSREVYLKINTQSSMLVHAQVLPMATALDADRKQDLLSALMLGLLFFVLAWSLLQWWLDRELITGLFVVKQAIVFAHASGYLGYWRVLFSDTVSPEILAVAFNATIFLMTVSATAFFMFFIKEYRPARWSLWVMGVSIALFPIQLALYALGYLHLALNSVALLSLLMPVLLIYMAFSTPARRAGSEGEAALLSKTQLVMLMLLLFVVLWIYAIPVLGIWASAPFVLFGILFYNIASGALMAFVMQARVRASLRARARTAERVAFLEREVERERSISEERSRFLEMLAHELRTPISTIRMLSQSGQEAGPAIDRAVADMQLIVDRCVQSGRLESQGFLLSKESFDLKSLLGDISQRVGKNASRLEVRFEGKNFVVESDPYLLMIVIQNLIDNALKYSPEDSVVRVTVKPVESNPSSGLAIEVVNSVGRAGLPDANQLFDKYYRSAMAKYRSGSGLGMFLAKGVCELLGAKLSYKPYEPGKGPAQAIFTVVLPSSITS